MRRPRLILAVPLIATSLLFAAGAAAGPGPKGHNNIRVHLKGFEEAPVVITGAIGDLDLTIDEAAGTIAYDLSYEGLEGNITQAHIHIGQRDVSGGIALWLCKKAPAVPADPAVAALTPDCPGTTSGTVSGLLRAANVIGPTGQGVPVTGMADVIAAIRAGKAYGNVHSTVAPGGEVRGQLH